MGHRFQGAFTGQLGGLTTTPGLANNLIDVISKVVAPGEWNTLKVPTPNVFGGFTAAPAVLPGRSAWQAAMSACRNNQIGAIGAGPAPLTPDQGGNVDIYNSNTMAVYLPAFALIVRGTARPHQFARRHRGRQGIQAGGRRHDRGQQKGAGQSRRGGITKISFAKGPAAGIADQ